MKAPHNRQTREQRANLFYALYAQMGVGRSIDGLSALTTTLGIPVARNTLARYSTQYGWQAQVAALDARRAEVEDSPAARVLAMNDRQANLGRMAQHLALRAFEAITKQTDSIAPGEAIRLAKDGQHIERLAMGEATSRSDLAITIYNDLVPAFVVVVRDAVNIPEIPQDVREIVFRRLGPAIDALIEAHAQGAPLDARIVTDEDAAPEADEGF